MKAYLAVAKSKHWVQIVTAKNSTDLFWAIDEFSDPYSFVFKCIKQIPVCVEIPLKSRKEDEGTFVFNCYSVPKTRDVQLGAYLQHELDDVCTGIPPIGWKGFVSQGVAQPYLKALGI